MLKFNNKQGGHMGEFSKDMSIEEILDKMNNNKGVTEIIHAGYCFLQYKLHQKLMKEQQNFQSKQLSRTTWLVIGTWALVITTILAILVKKN